MAVEWKTSSETVHTSTATWVGAKPRDGGRALVNEALDWIRENKTPGKLVVHLGTGGCASHVEFTQSQPAATPEEFDVPEE